MQQCSGARRAPAHNVQASRVTRPSLPPFAAADVSNWQSAARRGEPRTAVPAARGKSPFAGWARSPVVSGAVGRRKYGSERLRASTARGSSSSNSAVGSKVIWTLAFVGGSGSVASLELNTDVKAVCAQLSSPAAGAPMPPGVGARAPGRNDDPVERLASVGAARSRRLAARRNSESASRNAL
jgi:hypothetical protein